MSVREACARPMRHEVVWPVLAALVVLVMLVGVGVTTLAAPARGVSAIDLGFALAPLVTWLLASVAIGRFVRGGLIRQGIALTPASALVMAGGLVVTGAFCVLPYEFLLADVAGLTFDVVVPLWALGAAMLVGAVLCHLLAGEPARTRPAGTLDPQ
ncbi:MAG: hypothetical protein IPI32_00935 [Austwickia sp.]|nr:hypothetical protein [Austwickia sp.]MBK8437525.1 hypothetical protein [Austwickia sp.]MBK9102791.1 hypothetical protein [Austwickia sp.]